MPYYCDAHVYMRDCGDASRVCYLIAFALACGGLLVAAQTVWSKRILLGDLFNNIKKRKVTAPQVLLCLTPCGVLFIALGLGMRALQPDRIHDPTSQVLIVWSTLGLGANISGYALSIYIFYWLQVLELKRSAQARLNADKNAKTLNTTALAVPLSPGSPTLTVPLEDLPSPRVDENGNKTFDSPNQAENKETRGSITRGIGVGLKLIAPPAGSTGEQGSFTSSMAGSIAGSFVIPQASAAAVAVDDWEKQQERKKAQAKKDKEMKEFSMKLAQSRKRIERTITRVNASATLLTLFLAIGMSMSPDDPTDATRRFMSGTFWLLTTATWSGSLYALLFPARKQVMMIDKARITRVFWMNTAVLSYCWIVTVTCALGEWGIFGIRSPFREALNTLMNVSLGLFISMVPHSIGGLLRFTVKMQKGKKTRRKSLSQPVSSTKVVPIPATVTISVASSGKTTTE